MKYLLPILSAALVLCACNAGESPAVQLPPLTGEGFQVVVEIPAGTNRKVEFQKDTKTYRADRRVQFLPYPGNYGYIPATLMEESRGGDGDPLDVLLIAESLPTGSLLEAIPIGTLQLRDQGELDTKIIAVPLDSSLRVLPVANFQDLLLDYDPARQIIESWFLYYKGYGQVELIGWEDEQYAWREIEKWRVE